MVNFYDKILKNPQFYRQLNCRDKLVTIYNCPLETKFSDIWTQHNYVVYVTEGRKVWHTPRGSFDIAAGTCVFVPKGACIVEQFFDTPFCLAMFFLPDEFICEVIKNKTTPLSSRIPSFKPVIPIDKNERLDVYFHSMFSYFALHQEPDQSLLELKFRELILILADNMNNGELLSFFNALLNEPQTISLQRVMEENYCYNLRLEAFAQLCNRSLSAFKRDFEKVFNTSPGKWLMEKRLNYAMHLLSTSTKPVSEIAFESGFESPAHFSRAFRSHFDLSPSAIKQKETA